MQIEKGGRVKLYTAIAGILIFIFLGCAREAIKPDLTVDELFSKSMEEFNKKKYNLAIDGFKRLVFQHPGSELIDKAQFYLAESYLNSKDYDDAIVEYRFLIENFPESPFLDDASYKIGLCYYLASPPYYLDQNKTEAALKVLNSFIKHFPESEWIEKAQEIKQKCLDKLSKKELETGKLYYKLGHFKSAEIYLNNLLDVYPTSSYVDESKYTLALCYEKQGRVDEAKVLLTELMDGKGKFSIQAKKRLKYLTTR
ncbi:MAG: hypothetical protein B5M53_04830 [Candidatus Cloacimonas sp. 4484_209]|nr:MAG: hypothetical protein B5M53_04830 [Candidatus Cloacimonas sp. 4484_209]